VLNPDGTRHVSAVGEAPNPRELVSYEGAGYETIAGLASGPDGYRCNFGFELCLPGGTHATGPVQTVGRPAACQALKPPSRSVARSRPRSCSAAAARLLV